MMSIKDEGKDPQAKGHRWPLGSGEGKKMDIPETSEGTQLLLAP